MPSLKDLRVRINSVQSTQKITSAMKMVAASKLRRAQISVEEARPYCDRMERMMGQFVASLPEGAPVPELMSGRGRAETHLIVPVTSDRGLCGGFNANIARETRRQIAALEKEGKTVKLLCLGRKGRDALKRLHEDKIVDTVEDLSRTVVEFDVARELGGRLTQMFAEEEFDVCTVIYNRFQSAMTQHVTPRQLIPFPVPKAAEEAPPGPRAVYILEPDETEILEELVPRALAVQVFRALVESYASEQGARMTAMDNATRNAGDMIDALTLTYNRSRQAVITSELIEIISGAEAL